MTADLIFNFSGKTALITGGSTGIGKATALAFAKAGAKVILVDRNQDLGKQCQAAITSSGGDAFFVECDVSHTEQVAALFNKIKQEFGKLDFAFNNAGIEGTPANLAESTEINWDSVIDVNLKGVWSCMREEIKIMLEQPDGGVIVNCSSIAGLIGFPTSSSYVASKHGVIGLTKTAALECAKSKIRVNAICPGVIDTPMIDRFVHGDVEAIDKLTESEPMGRMGTPEEIANSVLWLCSSGSTFITGQALAVDGGWTAY